MCGSVGTVLINKYDPFQVQLGNVIAYIYFGPLNLQK